MFQGLSFVLCIWFFVFEGKLSREPNTKGQRTKHQVQSTKIQELNLFSYILYGLFILACLILIVVILLQPGKADAGALFSSSVSSTAFGPRGTASILSKITIGAAVAFMLIALMISLPSITGSHSVFQLTTSESS